MEQPSPIQPESSYHPKHHIKVYVWIALVVAAFGIAVNGYVYFLRLSYIQQGGESARQSNQEIQELRVQRSPSIGSGQFEVPSDWQTYRNDEYGFEFRYPGDWVIREPIIGSGKYQIILNPFPGADPSFSLPSITILNKSGSLIDMINKIPQGLDIYQDDLRSSYYVEGVESYEYKKGSDGDSGGSNNVAFIYKNNFYNLSYANQTDISQSFPKILSTFRFINTQEIGTLSGKVLIGPNCPVEREGVVCTPSPEAYASREFVVLDSNQKEVARFNADAGGNYSVALPAGTYTIVSVKTGMGYMSSDLPAMITIKAGQTINLDIDIDTGIR